MKTFGGVCAVEKDASAERRNNQGVVAAYFTAVLDPRMRSPIPTPLFNPHIDH
jgi:hypothetical protein